MVQAELAQVVVQVGEPEVAVREAAVVREEQVGTAAIHPVAMARQALLQAPIMAAAVVVMAL